MKVGRARLRLTPQKSVSRTYYCQFVVPWTISTRQTMDDYQSSRSVQRTNEPSPLSLELLGNLPNVLASVL